MSARTKMVFRLEERILEARRSLPFMLIRLQSLLADNNFAKAWKCSKAISGSLEVLVKYPKWQEGLRQLDLEKR
jgi:hypothetical protein